MTAGWSGQDRFIYTHDDVLRRLDALLESKGGAWWSEFFADRSKPCFGEDFLWALLATKAGQRRDLARVLRSCSYRTGSGPVVISDSVPMFEEACDGIYSGAPLSPP